MSAKQIEKSEHVLIIIAGAHLLDNYRESLRYLHPTHTYIIYEKAIMIDSPDDSDYIRGEKDKIRKAIKETTTFKENYGDPTDLSQLQTQDIDKVSVFDTLLTVKEEHPNASFSFNISSGLTQFIISLFIAAIWLDGKICLTKPEFIELPIPKLYLDDLNETQEKIIGILGNAYSTRNETETAYPVATSEIAEKLHIPAPLSPAERTKLSRILKGLRDLELLEENISDENRREKRYTLTESGIYTWKMLTLKPAD